jgi:DNA recombination protein RmuC
MNEILSWLVAGCAVASLLLLLVIWLRLRSLTDEGAAAIVREEFRNGRHETLEDARRLREEIASGQKSAAETVTRTIIGLGKNQMEAVESVERRVKSLVETSNALLERMRETIEGQMKAMQAGNEQKLEKMQEAVTRSMTEMKKSQQDELALVEQRVKALAESNETRLEKLRETLEGKMQSMLESNEKKLDQMRNTVDEKLQGTLEKRLGESFKLVSERLEAVQRGLGDMQNLAIGVGDLKRMLTNVKTRGTWGEFQIGDILEQILTPDQFQKNVKPKQGSGEIVEYAICLPGTTGDASSVVWLPIDAKFPQEDYLRLIDAAESADIEGVERSTQALVRSIQSSAKDIADKYIDPPHTTDFAIMFLPTEGLYSEVLRQPGLVEKLQQDSRVVVAGPTTLAALLNSLRMGFRTLAIEKRSSEVWTILSAVKTEFGKFGEVLSKVKKQLDTASNTIDRTSERTRAMQRKLREVEALPEAESMQLLGLADQESDLVGLEVEEDFEGR